MSRTITVAPLPDGVTQRNSWQTKVSGRRKGTHTRKRAAVNHARREANKGDIIEIHRTDGTIQSKTRYQGGSGNDTGSSSYEWDPSKAAEDIDGLTDVL